MFGKCNGGQLHVENHQIVDDILGVGFEDTLEEHVPLEGTIVSEECVVGFGGRCGGN